MESIESKVKQIISRQQCLYVEFIASDSRFIEDLGTDSLDAVEMVMDVEDEFEISIPDEVFEKFTTVGEAIAWITKEVAPQATNEPLLPFTSQDKPAQ